LLYLLVRKKIGRKGKVLGGKVGGWGSLAALRGDLQTVVETSPSEIWQSIGTTRTCTCFVGITNSSYLSGTSAFFGAIKSGSYGS